MNERLINSCLAVGLIKLMRSDHKPVIRYLYSMSTKYTNRSLLLCWPVAILPKINRFCDLIGVIVEHNKIPFEFPLSAYRFFAKPSSNQDLPQLVALSEIAESWGVVRKRCQFSEDNEFSGMSMAILSVLICPNLITSCTPLEVGARPI